MRTLTEWTLGGNMHPDDPTAKQPMDHDDFTRRYRHAFTACMVEAGHVPCRWLRRSDTGDLTFGRGALMLNRDGRPVWMVPEEARTWPAVQKRSWLAAARHAEALCEAIQ